MPIIVRVSVPFDPRLKTSMTRTVRRYNRIVQSGVHGLIWRCSIVFVSAMSASQDARVLDRFLGGVPLFRLRLSRSSG